MFGFLKKKPSVVLQTSELKLTKILEQKIPAEAVGLIINLWKKHPFNFRVTRERKSRLGDYIYKNKHHYITVNGSSNSYSFLITLIHEIAHQHVTIGVKFRKPAPHGKEWKNTFRLLMLPFLEIDVFPDEIKTVLSKHMLNPAASSTKDAALMKALGNESIEKEFGQIYLSEIADGNVFVFNNNTFKKIKNRRSRTLVESIKNHKQYTIPSHALVALED